MTNFYTLDIVEGVSRYAREEQDWSLFMDELGPIERLPDWVKRWKGDGIIVRSANKSIRRQLKRLRVPLVELLGDGQEYFSDVLSDETRIGHMAATHVWERGFRNFGFFSLGESWWLAGFRKYFVENIEKLGASVSICPTSFYASDMNISLVLGKKEEKTVLAWLDKLPKPAAVFSPRDAQCVLLLNQCRFLDLRVPEDVAILGVGNHKVICNTTTPTISSIDPNGRLTGYEAARLLNIKIEGKTLPDLPILIPPEGVVTRQSTDTISIDNPDFVAALELIRREATRRITVAEVANEIVVSRRTLSRWFRMYLDRSPEEEIIRVRMEKAKMLLRETTLSLEQIGKQVGYPFVEHFVRAFRKNFDQTPNSYRKRIC